MGKTLTENVVIEFDFDEGIVLYDATTQLYYCGMNCWNKQLRKAQIYHSKKHLLDQVEWMHSPTKKKDSPIDLDKAELKVIAVRTSAFNPVDMESYKKS